jgi:hypothetical protein
VLLASLFAILGLCSAAFAQATFTAQLRGVIQDPSQAAVPGATITITDDATTVSDRSTSDAAGRYIFNGLRPASYTLKVEAVGFKTLVGENIVLRVGQQADLDLTLAIGSVAATVEVKGTPPLLNSVSAALGQEVTNRYVTEVPLLNRDVSNLAFLAPGVTQVGGVKSTAQAISVDQTGTNFVSNGQRNSTAEIRLDAGLITAPEEGEGGMTMVYFKPAIESIQEFNVQNNSFSAEYGNNGGTVINMVTKSGTNQFHGVGYWFGRRPQIEANDFFANMAGEPKENFDRDQYGVALGGPIIKQKTFFFFDFDKVRDIADQTLTTTVPTALQRTGDFSQTYNADGTLDQIYNPFNLNPAQTRRAPFPTPNVIPSSLFDPVGYKLINAYPLPTSAGAPVTGVNNYTNSTPSTNPANQGDIKIDHNFSEKSRLSARYSFAWSRSTPSLYYGNAADNAWNEHQRYSNAVIEHTWTISPTLMWVNRIGVDRGHEIATSRRYDPTQLGFPAYLAQANGISIFPRVTATGYGNLGINGWVDTNSAHTQYQLASVLSKVRGAHDMKFGGERRIPFTNYWQPGMPDGWFGFTPAETRLRVYGANADQGNSLADMLLGWGNPYAWDGVDITPSSATKSTETAFFAQDNWRINSRLTFNLGLRYEWSHPYTERHNEISFVDPKVDTGINIAGIGEIYGANVFATPGHRTNSPAWNNWAPRLGFAYRVKDKTVIRGGAGIYYGMSPATNFASVAPAYRAADIWESTLDLVTQNATLSNPYPNGLAQPQGQKYGNKNMWGYNSASGLSNNFRNADIYQWSLSVQRQITPSTMLEVAYSASRSTHLPFYGTQNIDFISAALRQQYGDAGLDAEVNNPFYPLFSGSGAIFNEPASIYDQPTITEINLLRPYPQFNGDLEGNTLYVANSRYNALQIRVEKRYSHGLNFVGSYTYSKATDDSSNGQNVWLGNYEVLQDPTNLRGEQSVGGSDTPHRFVFGWSYQLPIGQGRALGNAWGRARNALLGGWQVNGFVTFQSGVPLGMALVAGDIADGTQRPNITGSIVGASIKDTVDGKGTRFNAAAFSYPPSQVDGNSPRFEDAVRGDYIHNLDLSMFKNFSINESVKVQLRAEFFNFTNTPRFDLPNTDFGAQGFGTISAQVNSPRQAQMGVRVLF